MTNEEWICPNGHYRYRIGSIKPNLVDDHPVKAGGHHGLECPVCGEKLKQGKYVEKEEDSWTTKGGSK
jgi:hypothetical protein